MVLFLDDLVILTIGLIDKPVNGRDVLLNEVFIIADELKDKVPIVGFDSLRADLKLVVKSLEWDGLIEVRNKRRPRITKYSLTELGKEKLKGILSSLEEKLGKDYLEMLRQIRIGLDQLGHEGLKNYIKTHYEEITNDFTSSRRPLPDSPRESLEEGD